MDSHSLEITRRIMKGIQEGNGTKYKATGLQDTIDLSKSYLEAL